MNKKYLMFAMALFAVGIVTAGYLVNSFSVQVDVAEPFVVSYAILGDAGNPAWQSATACSEVSDENYIDLSTGTQPVDFSYIYAGEDRVFCTMIENKAEVPIGYEILAEVREGIDDNCLLAFADLSGITGDAPSGITKVRKNIHVSAEAPIVNDCIVDISVGRTEASIA
jgi:hypothetical protein